jgi:gp16 family phage-associated protein
MKQATRPKTREEVRAEFARKGVSISSWAKAHGFSRSLVYEILTGAKRRTYSFGDSHRIAVMLGLKLGELAEQPAAVNAPEFRNLPKRAGGRK